MTAMTTIPTLIARFNMKALEKEITETQKEEPKETPKLEKGWALGWDGKPFKLPELKYDNLNFMYIGF